MILLYLASAVTGGLLLLLSLAGGHHDDAEADVELEAEASPEIELMLEALPIASLRFWTFLLAFGGLTGALLTWLSGLGPIAVAATALAVGYAAGLGVTKLVRWLAADQISSTLARDACVGVSGTVVLPPGRGALGRIRVRLENQIIDFDAETEDEGVLEISDPVVVYDVRDDGVVLVTSTKATKGKDQP
ncbi:MAG: hypothetical protein KF819_16235 [Labilithrix sp.]|nr:hypothetical protein [Labilithrix sp.]